MPIKDSSTTFKNSFAWKDKIKKAAMLSGKSYSEFIRYSAEKEADRIIIDSV
jgi:uncharacterized protein (DUF1778 family)